MVWQQFKLTLSSDKKQLKAGVVGLTLPNRYVWWHRCLWMMAKPA